MPHGTKKKIPDICFLKAHPRIMGILFGHHWCTPHQTASAQEQTAVFTMALSTRTACLGWNVPRPKWSYPARCSNPVLRKFVHVQDNNIIWKISLGFQPQCKERSLYMEYIFISAVYQHPFGTTCVVIILTIGIRGTFLKASPTKRCHWIMRCSKLRQGFSQYDIVSSTLFTK